MPTPSEQKALAFLAIVILLGGAARVVRAGSAPAVPPADQQALARQATAVDSATRATRPPGRKAAGALRSRGRRQAKVDTVAGVAGVPLSDVRPDGGDRAGWRNGFPPPSPRVDVPAGRSPRLGTVQGTPPAPGRIDMDVATAAELDALPRLGPAMAARLVANRDSFGPFGSLEALRRVRGVGPATLARLAPHVTFSGRPASLPPKG